MLTIFSTCKPFEGQYDTIQRNSIRSWLRIDNSQIILFGKEAKNIASDFGAYYKEPKCDKGYPYINSMFNIAQTTPSDLYMYTNADMIFRNIWKAVEIVKQRHNDFLIIGRRKELSKDIGPLTFENKWWKRLDCHSKLGDVCSIDYFLFTPQFWEDIPNFVVGHVAFDNWLVENALLNNKPVIDATKCITAYHQKHPNRPFNRPGKKHNLKLFGDSRRSRGFISHSTWRIVSGRLVDDR